VSIQRNFRSCYVPLSCAAFLITIAASSHAVSQTAPGSAAQPTQTASPDPIGEWTVAKQVARIKIADCDGKLWGVVSWEAKPGIDRKNPDPGLRSRPTLGMPNLIGMAPAKSYNGKSNKWEGEIYNSEDGHTYSANISLIDPNTLRVQGCFLGFLCGGENWTRFEPPDTAPPPAQRPATKSSNTRKTTGSTPEPTDDVCSRALGSAGLPHERGLK